jgi:hypothetical protein
VEMMGSGLDVGMGELWVHVPIRCSVQVSKRGPRG